MAMLSFCTYFVNACRESQGEIVALKEVLTKFCQDERWLNKLHARVGDDEESLLYCDDTLTIVHARLTPNIHFPPHEHRMKAVIATYEGTESHHLYKESSAGLEECGILTSKALDVCVLGTDAIHSIVNPGVGFSRSLHVYLGDLVGRRRRLWDHEGVECVNYRDQEYYAWSRPYRESRPFHRPKQASLCTRPQAGPHEDVVAAHSHG